MHMQSREGLNPLKTSEGGGPDRSQVQGDAPAISPDEHIVMSWVQIEQIVRIPEIRAASGSPVNLPILGIKVGSGIVKIKGSPLSFTKVSAE